MPDIGNITDNSPGWLTHPYDDQFWGICRTLENLDQPEAGTLVSASWFCHYAESGVETGMALYASATGALLAEQSASNTTSGAVNDEVITVNMESYSLVDTTYCLAVGHFSGGSLSPIANPQMHSNYVLNETGSGYYSGANDWYDNGNPWPSTGGFTNGGPIRNWMWYTYSVGGGGGGSKVLKTVGNDPRKFSALIQLRASLGLPWLPAYARHKETGLIVPESALTKSEINGYFDRIKLAA